MNKTKLGISTGLAAVIVCLLGYFGDYIALLLAVGYVLIREEDAWFRRTSVKVLLLKVTFSILSVLIGFLPSLYDVLRSFLGIFNTYIAWTWVGSIETFLLYVLGVVKIIVFAMFAIACAGNKEYKLGKLDKIIDKHIVSE